MADTDDSELEEEAEEPTGRERASGAILLASTVLLLGLGVAVFLYLTRNTEDLSSQGLDLASEPEPAAAAPEPAPAPVAPPPAPPKTFGVAASLTPPPVARPAPTDAKGRSELGLSQAARRNERYFRNLTIKYQNKYPVFHQWGKEWMSHPELRQARDDYYKTRNPVRFAFQVAGSPNLAKMMGKYSRNPEMQAYLKDIAAHAPKDVLTAFVDYLKKDGNAATLIERFARAAGLPPALVAGFTGKRVDQQEVMKQIMEQNPDLTQKP